MHSKIIAATQGIVQRVFRDRVYYLKMDSVGKDALDFNLDVVLGYLIGSHIQDKSIDLYIVSNDSGYQCCMDTIDKLDNLLETNIRVFIVNEIKSSEDCIITNRKKYNMLNSMIDFNRLSKDNKKRIINTLKYKFRLSKEQSKLLITICTKSNGDKCWIHNSMSNIDSIRDYRELYKKLKTKEIAL